MATQTAWQFKEGIAPEAGSFVPAPKSSEELQQITGRPTTYWSDAIRRIRRNKLAVVGFWIIIALFVVAIVGPMVSPYSYEDQDLENTFQSPTLRHPFGTDQLGRDQLTRVMYGSRVSQLSHRGDLWRDRRLLWRASRRHHDAYRRYSVRDTDADYRYPADGAVQGQGRQSPGKCVHRHRAHLLATHGAHCPRRDSVAQRT